MILRNEPTPFPTLSKGSAQGRLIPRYSRYIKTNKKKMNREKLKGTAEFKAAGGRRKVPALLQNFCLCLRANSHQSRADDSNLQKASYRHRVFPGEKSQPTGVVCGGISASYAAMTQESKNTFTHTMEQHRSPVNLRSVEQEKRFLSGTKRPFCNGLAPQGNSYCS